MKIRDLKDQTYGELVVMYKSGANRQGSIRWVCKCICGNEATYSSDHLTRKTNPVRSCGCKQSRKGHENKLWSGCGEISGDWWYGHVLRERKQTSRPKVGVTVTKEFAWDLFLKQNKKCALSGIDIRIGNMSTNNTASIDRIDSSRGYEEGNIQWVHKDVNFMKRTYSMEYFIKMCKLIAENNI